MDSDEERSVHEEEEDEERNEARSDDEEQQETKEPEKEVDPRFLEKLPSRRESVSEVVVNLRAIHTDEGEEAAKKDAKQTPLEKINVRVVMPEDIQYDLFAKRYKKNLREMVRENVLRQLQEDVDGRRAFQQYCTEQDEALAGEGADDEEEEEAEGFEEVNRLDNPNPPPPPYWLPSLLSNDAVYVERVLAAMYGWALPPAPVLKPNKKGQSVSFGVEKSDGEAEEGEEEEEEVNEDGVRVAPVKKRLSYFHQNDAFADSVRPTDEDSEEEHDGEKEDSSSKDNSEKRIPSVHSNAGEKPVARDSGPSQSVVPLYSIPNFPYSRYVFYLCYDRNNEEWLLLSVHPRLYTLQVKNQRKEGGKEGEEEEPEEEEEEEEDEENGSGKAAARRADKSVVVVPDFDYTTLLKMDGLLLSILCCPTALRFCLLQKQSVPNSLQALEDWLRKDFIAAFPYLSTLYTALLSVRSKDEHRLPYKLPSRVLDFNLFFTPRYLSVARAAADSANKGKEELPPVLIGGAQLISKTKKEKADTLILLKQVEEIASPLTAEARNNIQALLTAGITPSNPPRLEFLTSNEAIRLALWLYMVAPEVKIEEWKKLYKKRITQLKELKMEDNEEEEEQDEDDNPLTESFVLDQIEQEKEKEAKIKERQTILDPVLLPSPLLINTITELRRRLLREAAGKPPSKHTLEACLQEFLNETHVEDGALHDPLVTKNFYLYTAGPAVVGEDQANDTSNAHFRHQKVFQSDLVLLLLALLTSPRSGGAKSIVPHTISEDLSESMKRPQSSRRMTKVLKKMSAHINKSTTDVDAHTLTFVDLLQMKVDKHVTPLDKVRSGMMRLLFLNLPRFLLSKSVILLCEAAPLYEMLGLNESCPLPDLVNGWSAEITLSKSLNPSTISSTSSFLNTFVNYFWDEIYTRLEEKLYDKPAVQVMSQKMPSLLEKVRERHGQFVGVLDLISRRVKVVVPRGAKTAPTGEDSNNASKRLSLSTDRGSKQVRTLSLSMSMGGIDGKPVEYKSGEATSAFGIDSEKHVTLTNPSPYSEEYQQEEQRVRAILESLPMASKSIYSPKTLFHLLFRNTDVDVVTVKFVLKQPSVNGQVSANPLRDTAVPALQYAIEEHNFTIAKLLVGLGASLEELTDEGTTVLRCLAEEVFTEEEVSELMEVYRYNQRAVAADPNLGFGIYRTLAVDETDV